jgi:mono/diheme cytochrome c family protein
MTGRHVLQLAACAALLAGASVALDQAAVADSAPSSAVLAQGQYLVTDAGQCADCHGATFGGAPLHIPGPPGVPWATTVPSLRGLPMFATDADAIAFLHTAKLPNGNFALGPMPHFKFNTADASAIVAYLRTLK